MKTKTQAESDEGGLETEIEASDMAAPVASVSAETPAPATLELPSESDVFEPGSVDASPPFPAPAAPSEATSPTRTKSTTLQSIIDLLHDLAIAVIVCVLLITYVVQAFKVQGTSMSPELRDGERILVNKFVYRMDEIERGDVVVFWYPEDPELSFIKRVIGLPGESVELRAGEVYIDGVHLPEIYVSSDNADERSAPAQEIRPGHYFVLGDNRRGSNDSRSWGLVPKRYIYGKAFVRIWPPGDAGVVE